MKYSPDAYLLHESNKFITFNIRIKVVMKDQVDSDVLTTAAQKAFKRFPYYSKQIHGVFKNHLPVSKLESAPVTDKI